MPRSKTKAKAALTVPSDEWWTVVQVASCLAIPYQTARNRMLEGRFGESQYDAKTRRLTVLASRVLARKRRRKGEQRGKGERSGRRTSR